MSREADRGEREHRLKRKKAKHYHAEPLRIDELIPGLNPDDPYDLANPCYPDPTANEERKELSDLERQVIAFKKLKQKDNQNVCPPTDRPTVVPPCKKCGVWPCLGKDSCPDLEFLSRGRIWLAKEHRLMTLEEMAVIYTKVLELPLENKEAA